MAIRVLIVDDSGFFRRRLAEMLRSDPRLEVAGEAANGAEAVEKATELRPDVITMDIEMPVMDGITAVRRIMAARPTPTLMFSSLTTDGAKPTLDALEAGAVDYLPKRFEDISQDREEARRALCDRVYTVARSGRARTSRPSPPPRPRPEPGARPQPAAKPEAEARPEAERRPPPAAKPPPRARPGQFKLVAIGTSTGGPVALQEVLTRLPASFPFPILVIQHMPASFTPAFAQRLDQNCAIRVREAHDGDALEPGTALLAPGGKQMVTETRGGKTVVRIKDSLPGQNYKPSVDETFTSLATTFPGQVLAVVLTGMGADGRDGARRLKEGGSAVWAQDEATCVVYGMPAAIAEAGLADSILGLPDIGPALAQQG